MSNQNNLKKLKHNPEKLGRWVCYEFYRSADVLLTLEGVHEIFEDAANLHNGWATLLSGGFRHSILNPRTRAQKQNPRNTKYTALGEIIYPGLVSIDGIGEVRALEVLLYRYVGRELIRLLS